MHRAMNQSHSLRLVVRIIMQNYNYFTIPIQYKADLKSTLENRQDY